MACQTGPLDLTGPIDLNTSGNCVIGSLQPDPTNVNANAAAATVIAQTILDLAIGVTGDYSSHAVDDYSGMLTQATSDDRFDVPDDEEGDDRRVTGYEYVLGKYDGQNAGFVLFYCAFDCTIRGLSDSLWTNGASNGYGLSNWTGFNPGDMKVSEPGTLALLGLGLAGLGFARRRRKA
jgi:hypothetical protein